MNTNMNGVELIDTTDVSVVLFQDLPVIQNVDTLVGQILSLRSQIEDGSYGDGLDDRKHLTELRAYSNKILAEVKKRVKAFETEIMEPSRAQLKIIEGEIGLLSSTIKMRIDQMDSSFREGRVAFVEKSFNDSMLYRKYELDIKLVMNARWMNRSADEKKIPSEIESRLKSIDVLVAQGMEPEVAARELIDTDWNLAEVLTRSGAVDIEVSREESHEDVDPIVRVTVELKTSELPDLEKLASRMRWSITK